MEDTVKVNNNSIISREVGVDDTPIDFINNAMSSKEDSFIEKKEINSVSDPITEPVVDPLKDDTKEPVVEPQSYKAKIKANPIPIFAKYAKENGVVPEDFEIKDDMSFQELNEALWKKNEDRYVSIAENRLREDRLKRGITPEVEERAKRLSGNVTEEEITEYDVLSQLSSYQLDSSSEAYEDQVSEYLTYWYGLKGLPENKIKSNVEQDLQDKEALPDIIKAARGDFSSEALKLDRIQQDKVEAANKQREKDLEDYRSEVKRTLKSGKIGKSVYTPEQMKMVENALFVQSEIYEDEEGRSWRVTPYRKKVLETKRNPELRLKQKVDFILGVVTDSVDNRKTEKKAINEFVKGLSDLVDVEIAPTKGKGGIPSSVQGGGIVRRELN